MHKQLEILFPEVTKNIQVECLGRLARILGSIAQMNKAETGQHLNHKGARGQANVFVKLRELIPKSFRESRELAAGEYARIGSVMCSDCLGRDACPLRTYDTPEGPKPHINPDESDVNVLAALEVWYTALKQSARNNIKGGTITPVTINQSRNGMNSAHKAAA
jgi:hypothetical protein